MFAGMLYASRDIVGGIDWCLANQNDEMCIRDRFHTVHGDIQTPVFMNVGTVGAIKGAVSTDDLKAVSYTHL